MSYVSSQVFFFFFLFHTHTALYNYSYTPSACVKRKLPLHTAMSLLPNTPFQPLSIRATSTDSPSLIIDLHSKRLQLSINNTSDYISQLEDYLSAIVESLTLKGVSYDNILDYASSVVFSDSVPWQLVTKQKSALQWTLQDEIITVCCNISMGYVKRSYELMVKYTTDHSNGQDDPKFWINAFKLLKKSMEYTRFVSTVSAPSTSTETWETSLSFVKFVESCVQVSIQYTFLSKCLWKLKDTEFNIINDEINYSTLCKVAIYIKSELLNMIKETRYHKLNTWSEQLETVLKLVNGIIGAFVSIQNYKEDKIGVCIGFMNMAVDNITTKATSKDDDNALDEEENKLKKKLSMFKRKVKDAKIIKTSKLKVNTNVYNKLSPPLQHDYTNLFELIELLHLKYHLENNNLKFDKVVEQQELINYTPLGRAVPVDVVAWRPVQTGAPTVNTSGYY